MSGRLSWLVNLRFPLYDRSGGSGGRAKQVNLFVGDGDEDTSQSTDSIFDMAYQSRAPLLESQTLSPDAAWILDTAIQLHHIMHLTAKDFREGTEGLRQDGRDVMKPTMDIPEITEEQMRLAYFVIPQDYWCLQCWNCREEGHSICTCPYLTEPQRIYFA